MARLDGAQDLDTAWAALAQEAHSALIAQGVADPVLRRFADCRYTGQSHELRIPAPPEGDLATAFAAAHEAAYGYAMPAEPVHAVTLRVVAEGVPVLAAPPIPEPTVRGPGPARTPTREILLEGARVHAAVVRRCDLRPGDVVTGPAIIDQDDATTLLAHGERGAVDDAGNLVVRWDDEPDRSAGAGAVPDPPASAAGVDGDPVDPVGLEVLRHALQGVAEEMGIALRRAAYSPNIKERADCSAAVFAPDGELVAQAEHIPVHLGSMPASVRAALDAFGGGLEPGMQVAVNDPYAGGTHLPDLTIVSCVGGTTGLLGYVANRAHHADVGGAAPGSMPAAATDIAMEGLRVPPVLIATAKGPRTDVCELIAANSRTPAERHGDLRAQLAANHVGAVRLTELAKRFGRDGLHAAMGAVRDYGDRRVRAAIARIPDGTYRFADQLEVGPDGLRIAVAVTVDGERVIADFAGSAPQVPVNCNAVLAVTQSAAAFVLRMLTDPDAPANEGTTRSLEVRAPAGSVVHATFPAPVAAGNVETSQRIVDVLLGAFAQALPDVVPAASQGTMNNVLLGAGPGAPPYSYYETIAGGEGGTPSRPGMSGVHTGMTNTRNTPAEAMELAYPLRVWRAELRHGTGGQGRHPGGEGVVREIEVLLPSILTLQTERRTSRPWGLAGGGDGAVGRNLRIDAGGAEQPLAAKGTWALEAGERVRIETPGGGGWGTPPEHDDGRASG
jgi:N-methylhydantoinase B